MTRLHDLLQTHVSNVSVDVVEPGCRRPVPVRGPVVHDPEDLPRRGVGLGLHHLVHERGEQPAQVPGQAFARSVGQRGDWCCGRPRARVAARFRSRTAMLVVGAARSCCGMADKGLS